MVTLLSVRTSRWANAVALLAALVVGLYHYELPGRTALIVRQSALLHGNASTVHAALRDLELFAFLFPGYEEVLPAAIFDGHGGLNKSAVNWRPGELFTGWWNVLPLTDLVELTSTLQLERYDFGKTMIFQDRAPMFLLRYEFLFDKSAKADGRTYTRFEIRMKTLRTSALFDLTAKQYYKWMMWSQARKRVFDLRYHFDPK